jgi:hypothetical protein
MLNDCALPGTLSTVNAVSMTLSAILRYATVLAQLALTSIRTICPALISSIFAMGLKAGVNHLGWYVVIALGALGVLSTPLFPHQQRVHTE